MKSSRPGTAGASGKKWFSLMTNFVFWLYKSPLYQNFPFAQSFQKRLFTLIGLLFTSSSSHIFGFYATNFVLLSMKNPIKLLFASAALRNVRDSSAVDLIPWLRTTKFHSTDTALIAIQTRNAFQCGTRAGNSMRCLLFEGHIEFAEAAELSLGGFGVEMLALLLSQADYPIIH